MARLRVAIDIGGTFTDIVFLDRHGRRHVKEVSSSVEDYARAIVDGLREVFEEAALTGADVVEVLHGTTGASNALLERRGARAGLITTRGFRDVLEIRRLRMPRLYDLTWEKPPALVERRLRLEVDERVDATGGLCASPRAAANRWPSSPSPAGSPASSMRCCEMAACSSPSAFGILLRLLPSWRCERVDDTATMRALVSRRFDGWMSAKCSLAAVAGPPRRWRAHPSNPLLRRRAQEARP